MAEEEKEKGAGTISRRDFIKDAGLLIGGAAVGAAAGAGITYGVVSPKEAAKEGEVAKPVTATPVSGAVQPAFEPVVSVIRGPGFGDFGRPGPPNRVDVRGGKIVRIRPINFADEGYTKEVLKPWKIEVSGIPLELPMKGSVCPGHLGYKKRVYSPNRILYPLKRVDWEPGGDPAKINPQNRGISKYKRISWDEATDIIASEMKRIHDKYGVFAVLAQGDGHGEGKVVHGPHGCQTQLLRFMGPDIQHSYTVQIRTPDSWEGYYWGGKHMWGGETTGTSAPSSRYGLLDIVDNIQLVMWTNDPERTTGTSSGHWTSVQNLFWRDLSKKLGKENVLLSPEYNYTAAAFGWKWIPVKPCMDGALHLAMQYIWLTEGTYDKNYIATHTVGFDKYADYVLGKEDGIPKTPAWAAPRCGVAEWRIKALAKQLVKKNTAWTGSCGAMMRAPYGEEVVRQYIATLGMQGLPGYHSCRTSPVTGLPTSNVWSASMDRGRNPDMAARGLEENEVAKDDFRSEQFIPKTLIHDAILNPPISWYGTASPKWVASDQFRKFTFPIAKEKGGTDIHMIWTDTPCWTVCWNDGFTYTRALRDPKIEFILTEHPWLENDTLYSDIILPTTTAYEEYDIGCGSVPEGWAMVWVDRQCIAPIGESKTDYEVSLEVAKKLEKLGGRYAGIVNKYTWGKSVEGWMEVGWKQNEMEKKTGLTWAQFKDKEYVVSPRTDRKEGDLRRAANVTNFYDDPVANKLQTPTGLLEYESTALKANLPDDRERPPVPKWIIGGPGWSHDELPAPDGVEKYKKYPLLLQSLHPKWRHHAQRDDVSWLREIPTCKVKGPDGYLYEPLWINPVDAEPRGIKNGDVVSIFNERGTVLGGAYVTGRVCPGGVYQDHGARIDLIAAGPDEWIDRGGSNNMIMPRKVLSQNAAGQVASGILVQVEKTDLAALMAKYPEAFARDYDPGSGLRFTAWVEGG